MIKFRVLLLIISLIGAFASCQKAVTPDLTSTLGGTYNLTRLLVGPTSLAATGNAVVTVNSKSSVTVKVTVQSSSGVIASETGYAVSKENDNFLLKDATATNTLGTFVGNQLTLQVVINNGATTLRYTGEFVK
jgi:hypothetical protein